MKIIHIKSEDIGQRLDVFLTSIIADQSRSYIGNQIKLGLIKVNQSQVKAGYILKAEDVIEMTEDAPKPMDLTPVDLNLEIVYEDDELMVINKPSGLVVHPASSYHEPTLVHGLLFDQSNLSDINGVIRPGIVHRIDKDTSGLLVVAKTNVAHQALSLDLKDHQVKREYIALVYGHFAEREGVIDAPIKRHPKQRLKMTVIKDGKYAVTHFKVIASYEKYSLIRCELETGRTHQIRVHLAYIGHPVVGDPLYGPKDVVGKTGQFLHAERLSFSHPIKKEMMTFTATIPKVFKDFLDVLK